MKKAIWIIISGLACLFTVSTANQKRNLLPEPYLIGLGHSPAESTELLQYTAGGHVLGFRKGEMLIASGDHSLKPESFSFPYGIIRTMDSLPEIKKHLISLAQEIEAVFPDLYLAGGTAIMIKYEHRISYDLDLFAERTKLSTLEFRMRKRYESEIERIIHFPESDNIDIFLRGTKLSFVTFPFPNVEPTEIWEGIRIAADRDLLLNKVYVAGRRVEAKDPVDIACLLLHHPDWPLDGIQSDFRTKFKDEKFEIYLAAVMAFDDYPGLDDAARSVLERWNGSN